MIKKYLQIAIDGPVAAGKGTVARILAKKLKITFVDTGAMYRAAALLGIRNHLNLKTEVEALVQALKKAKIEIEPANGEDDIPCLVFLNGEDVSYEIRTPQISQAASDISVFPLVRKVLVARQKKLASSRSVVMEGRDITTRVLPKATLKIFLTAKQEERARRRLKQLRAKGINKNLGEVLIETVKRDKQDSQRKADPLTVTQDAWVLDTTNLNVEEVVEKIIQKLKEQKAI
jgi:cytidylate kinase